MERLSRSAAGGQRAESVVDVDIRRDLLFVREIIRTGDSKRITTFRKAVIRSFLGECAGTKQDCQRKRLHY